MRMSRKGSKKGAGQSANFLISLITLSIIFIMVGYLIGNYAVKMLQQQHRVSMQQAREESRPPAAIAGTPAAAPASSPPAAVAAQASQTAATQPQPPTQTQSQSSTSQNLYKVQVGAFSERVNAERVVSQLKEAGYEAVIVSGPPHRVQTGAFSSQENANKLAEELRQKGFEAIVVR